MTVSKVLLWCSSCADRMTLLFQDAIVAPSTRMVGLLRTPNFYTCNHVEVQATVVHIVPVAVGVASFQPPVDSFDDVA